MVDSNVDIRTIRKRLKRALRARNTRMLSLPVVPVKFDDIKVAQLGYILNEDYPLLFINSHIWWMIERFNRGEYP